jgi:gamma-glutamylcyclotransferase (GGCT)/AIG2-like uncharacterized protein YtfP
MDAPVFHLFVYGSLRQGFQNPVFDYIKKHFTFVAEGKVKGLLYDMGEYPAAVPSTENGYIIGELYEAKSEDDFYWAISQLDDYEGLHPEEGESSLYYRDQAHIFHDGGSTTAWLYWYSGAVQGNPVIESGDVLEYFHLKNRR